MRTTCWSNLPRAIRVCQDAKVTTIVILQIQPFRCDQAEMQKPKREASTPCSSELQIRREASTPCSSELQVRRKASTPCSSELQVKEKLRIRTSDNEKVSRVRMISFLLSIVHQTWSPMSIVVLVMRESSSLI